MSVKKDPRLKPLDLVCGTGSLLPLHALAMNVLKRAVLYCVEINEDAEPTMAKQRDLGRFMDWVLNVASDPLNIQMENVSAFKGAFFLKEDHPMRVITRLRAAVFELTNGLVRLRIDARANLTNATITDAVDEVEDALVCWLTSPHRKRLIVDF